MAITFWANREQSQYIITKPLHKSQKLLARNGDGSCTFQIEVVQNIELFSVLMSYGPGLRVLSPPKAVKFMSDTLHDAAKAYDQPLPTEQEQSAK